MSIKLKIGWTDNNVITEGVRIYKSSTLFDVNTLPAIYAEIIDGSLFYEDLDVIDGQTYFYMLSCFLGEQEMLTECYEVLAQKEVTLTLTGGPTLSTAKGTLISSYNIAEPYRTGENLITVMLMSQGEDNLVGLENWNHAWSGGGGWGFRIFWKHHESNKAHSFRKSDNAAFRMDIALLTFFSESVISALSVVANSVALSSATSPVTTPPITAPLDKAGWQIAVVNRPIVNTTWTTTAPDGYIGIILSAGSTGTSENNSYNRVSAVAIKQMLRGQGYDGATFTYTNGTSFSYGQAMTIQLCAY